MPSCLLLQAGMFAWRQWDMRPSFVLKCLTCIFWFALKVSSETQFDPWETMQPFNGPRRGVCLHKSLR